MLVARTAAVSTMAVLMLCCIPVRAEHSPYAGMLDNQTIGAAAFLKANPDGDGRGVVIAVLDSGVDVDVDGLRKTPSGEHKIVDVRDFSGEGQVRCVRVGVTGNSLKVQGREISGLPVLSGTEVFAGFLDERRFAGSDIADLNRNGRLDDLFAVVAFMDSGAWRVLVDTTGDWNMSDAVEAGPWAGTFSPVRFAFRGQSPVNAALSVDGAGGDSVDVGFHIAAGAHGTHVAGIAAGSGIAGQPGYDGIAPGARILSLKIGRGSLAGGATVSSSIREALEFAARWGREHSTPVVVNLSYGVGSSLEGQSDIDRFCEEYAVRNPHVLVVASAGNNGPGLSTVGSPGASAGVLTVGAVVPPSIASELLGVEEPSVSIPYGISSRGGELAKPDVAAPGIAVSSIPGWLSSDTMGGTSMAAPQVAGAAALVMSAVGALQPQAKYNSGMLARAFKASARPLKGWTPIDFGAGVIDVPGAYKAFRKMLGDPSALAVQALKVEVDVPTLRGGKGQAVYWRSSGWAPGRQEAVPVRIKPLFSVASGVKPPDFFARFSVSADRPWIGVSKTGFHVRGESSGGFDTWIRDVARLGPGVHTGAITVKSAGGVAATIPVTVVVPHRLVESGVSRILSMTGVPVARSGVTRIPFDIPEGASSLSLSVSGHESASADIFVHMYDGAGNRVGQLSGAVRSSEGVRVGASVSPGILLDGGTCELVLAGSDRTSSKIDLHLSAGMVSVQDINSLDHRPGKSPSVTVEAIGRGPDAFAGSVSGRIAGFETERQVRLQGGPLSEGLSIGPEFERIEVEMEMSGEDFAKLTDVAVNVVDRDGRHVLRTAMNGRRIVFDVPGRVTGQADYRLQVTPAFATGGDIVLTLRTRYFWKVPVELVGTIDGARLVRLYPGVTSRLKIEALGTPPSIPAGAVWYGHVEFVDRRDGRPAAIATVRARPR